ncbi:Vacuolar protein sorting-associated protein vps5 [Rhizina undulata]
MVLATCWRCLRPSAASLPTPTAVRVVPNVVQRSPFTTSTSLFSAPNKKKTNMNAAQAAIAAMQKKRGSQLRIKKKAPQQVKKAMAIGERKALRKTIVLSNINAPNVEIPELTEDLATHAEAVNTVFAIPNDIVDQLRKLGVFQTGQNWEYFYRPSTLVREESLKIGQTIGWISGEKAAEKPKEVESKEEGKFHRMILDGRRGVGKSVLMLQAMTWALEKNWMVLSIPNAQDLVVGHTDYEFDAHTGLWMQKDYTASLLKRILEANSFVISQMSLSKSYHIGRQDIPEATSMKRFLEMGITDPTLSYDVFNSLIHELTQPNSPPVLFTLENLSQLSLPTAYRDPSFNLIHPHDLAIGRIFTDFLSGHRRFPRGLVLAATSSNSPQTPALDLALAGLPHPPYMDLDTRIALSVRGAEVIIVGNLGLDAAKALMQYWGSSGVGAGVGERRRVVEALTLAGGNIKELLAGELRIKA